MKREPKGKWYCEICQPRPKTELEHNQEEEKAKLVVTENAEAIEEALETQQEAKQSNSELGDLLDEDNSESFHELLQKGNGMNNKVAIRTSSDE